MNFKGSCTYTKDLLGKVGGGCYIKILVPSETFSFVSYYCCLLPQREKAADSLGFISWHLALASSRRLNSRQFLSKRRRFLRPRNLRLRMKNHRILHKYHHPLLSGQHFSCGSIFLFLFWKNDEIIYLLWLKPSYLKKWISPLYGKLLVFDGIS